MDQTTDSNESQELILGTPGAPPTQEYSTIWLTFVAFGGDHEKTAAAVGLAPGTISKFAGDYNWDAKLDTLRKIRREQGPDAFAKELNRTVNLVQAIRCRNLLDNVVSIMANLPRADVRKMLSVPTKGGSVFSARALTDLVKAVETAQDMTYKALGDTLGNREKDNATSAGLGSLAVLKSLAEGTGLSAGPDASKALSEQLEGVQEDVTSQAVENAKLAEMAADRPGQTKHRKRSNSKRNKGAETLASLLAAGDAALRSRLDQDDSDLTEPSQTPEQAPQADQRSPHSQVGVGPDAGAAADAAPA